MRKYITLFLFTLSLLLLSSSCEKKSIETKESSSDNELSKITEMKTHADPSVTASSQTSPWKPENILSSTERTYWMSAVNSGNEEWVTISYPEPFVAKHVSIVLNNGRQGTNPKIQGSTDGVNWINLGNFNAFDYPNDSRNFRHIDFVLDNTDSYKYYRYHSDPTVYLLIEYLNIQPEVSVTSSSQYSFFKPENVLSSSNKTSWLSGDNTGNEEWIAISYHEPFVAKHVSIILVNGRQGTNPKIQGSTDGVTWTTLANINAFDYPDDSHNCRHINLELDNTNPYKYYRYHSDPTGCVWIIYLNFQPEASVTGSSQTGSWNSKNILSTTVGTYWMSDVNSGNEEWVTIEYATPFIGRSVTIVLNNGRQGNNPKIQGSTDGVNWINLGNFNAYDYPNDSRNFRHINFMLDNTNEYKYYRYHSGSTVYVLIEYMNIMP
jgi:hypothetical protein